MRKTLTIVGGLFGAACAFYSGMVSYMHVYKDEPPFSLGSSLVLLVLATIAGSACGFCAGWLFSCVRKPK